MYGKLYFYEWCLKWNMKMVIKLEFVVKLNFIYGLVSIPIKSEILINTVFIVVFRVKL